ncbi:hypothetical protein K466DRAFT_217680 [Polyporus arcularius HHB13444]|uniref:F-box domain-containing protein n=1 Tax=Polyporus arcularius HHB13444 TaxID=1314778 RepID=A0A5C3PT23_9APHY|nr:hypothetical protein K466DRAFT_217680 [Polyporus arcularius HHB13444]
MHEENPVTPDESHMAHSSCGPRPLPPDDLALFSGLPPHKIPAVADARIQAYRTMIEDINGYIAQLTDIHNAAITLHATLPREVLMNVFRHVYPTCPSDIRITHVCKLWRDLIHRTPEFWVNMLAVSAVTSHLGHNIDSDSPMSLLSFIELSSPMPYKLDIQTELSFLTKIPSHTSRICSLSWELPGRPDFISLVTDFLDLHMPLLQEMRCSCNREHAIPPLITALPNHHRPQCGKFPRLRSLSLHGLGVACQALAFPSLKELHIDDGAPIYFEPLGLSALLKFLQSCSQLQVLVLDINASALHAFPERQPEDAVSLPYLTTLSLTFHRPAPRWAYDFLERVDVPSTAELKITWLCGCGTPLTTLIPASRSTSIKAIQAMDFLDIRYIDDRKHRASESKAVLTVHGRYMPASGRYKPCLTLTIHRPCWRGTNRMCPPSTALGEIMELFYHASLKSLWLRLDAGITVRRQDWSRILNGHPSLLSLIVRIGSCRNLLSVMRRHPSRWPALQWLTIVCRDGSGVHESLLSVLENRAREGSRLKLLTFSGDYKKPALSEHRMRRLQGLVREVKILRIVYAL